MFYLDTSVIVTALTLEAETLRIQKWLSSQQAGSLAISHWVVSEFSSALSLKLRNKEITEVERASALTVFGKLRAESVTILPITSDNFVEASRFCDNYTTGLRAADALHLAVAAANEAVLCTRDKRLQLASLALGIEAELV